MVKPEAFKLVQIARTKVIMMAAFYGCLSLQLKIVCGDNLQFSGGPLTTMAVDGINLYYCTEFVLKIGELELQGVVAHEVSHCSHRHFGRQMGRENMAWNVAGDLVINPEIIAAGFKLPGEPRTLDQMLAGEVGYLLDPMFDGWSTEEIYAYVKKKMDQKKKQDQEDGQGKPGNGKDQQVLDPGGCGGIVEPQMPDENGNIPCQDELDQKWEQITRQAIEVAKSDNEGKVPGYLKSLVEQLGKPRVNWNQQLRRWADQSMRKEITWGKPNKRFLHMGLFLPGTKSNGIGHLVCGVDTSASVDEDMLAEFATEVASLLDQGFCDKITVIYADTKVNQVDEYIAGDILKLEAVGRGGTDFRATFEYIEENIHDTTGIIYFSDMYVSQYGEAPNCPTLWATYGREKDFERQSKVIPFGDVIHIH